MNVCVKRKNIIKQTLGKQIWMNSFHLSEISLSENYQGLYD